jgi:hypothetical protein
MWLSAKNMVTEILCQLGEGGEYNGKLLPACFGSARYRSFLLLVESDTLSDGISMNTQGSGGFGKVGFIPDKRLLDIDLLKLIKCFGQQYVAVKHFLN